MQENVANKCVDFFDNHFWTRFRIQNIDIFCKCFLTIEIAAQHGPKSLFRVNINVQKSTPKIDQFGVSKMSRFLKGSWGAKKAIYVSPGAVLGPKKAPGNSASARQELLFGRRVP